MPTHRFTIQTLACLGNQGTTMGVDKPWWRVIVAAFVMSCHLGTPGIRTSYCASDRFEQRASRERLAPSALVRNFSAWNSLSSGYRDRTEPARSRATLLASSRGFERSPRFVEHRDKFGLQADIELHAQPV
jgi:hypothetical protein